MSVMILCCGFRVGYVMNLGFGWFGTLSLRLLPNCMNMNGFCAKYAATM